VATDRIKHLYHSISEFYLKVCLIHLFKILIDLEDKEKIGELKEIEQEELYINMLKEQRERVEILFYN